jgi:predicted permease
MPNSPEPDAVLISTWRVRWPWRVLSLLVLLTMLVVVVAAAWAAAIREDWRAALVIASSMPFAALVVNLLAAAALTGRASRSPTLWPFASARAALAWLIVFLLVAGFCNWA